MNSSKPNKLAMVLAFIAAALAITAAVVGHYRNGTIRWEMIAAGVFLAAWGIGIGYRR